MSSHSASVGPELRSVIRTVLASLDPAIQIAADYAAGSGSTPGQCQQPWCPLCALIAFTDGEHHPLSTLIAEHGASLLAVLRAMVNDNDGTVPASDQPRSSGYQSIPITVAK